MMKEVIISIKGSQTVPGDPQADVIEFTTDGKYGIRNGGYYLSYDESNLIGVPNVKLSIYIKPDNTVILQRTGSMQSRLVVQKGVRNSCFYQTAEGELYIGIFGEKVRNRLSEGGGSVQMQYTIDSNLNLVSRNEVNISVKEGKKDVNSCF